jgi:Domain of unknown function (DUF4126)
MDAITALAQSLGLAYASGISLYATVFFVGLAEHQGWIGPLPGALGILGDPLVFGAAGVLAAIEALALLVPGIATAWETVHTGVRPFAAAALAVLGTWGSPRVALVAGLVGGALGLATHATKLGLRALVDTSPEPVSNAVVTTAELGVVAALSWAIWNHPWLSLAAAIALLVATLFAVRTLARIIGRTFRSMFRRAAAP